MELQKHPVIGRVGQNFKL